MTKERKRSSSNKMFEITTPDDDQALPLRCLYNLMLWKTLDEFSYSPETVTIFLTRSSALFQYCPQLMPIFNTCTKNLITKLLKIIANGNYILPFHSPTILNLFTKKKRRAILTLNMTAKNSRLQPQSIQSGQNWLYIHILWTLSI